MYDVSNKVVLVTGGAGFLGSIYCDGFSKNLANVVIADTNLSKCKVLAKTLKSKYNTDPLAIKLDLTKKPSIKKMISQIIKKYKKIDVLINNASYVEGPKERMTPLEKLPINNLKKVLDVNISGMFSCCQEVGKIMVHQKNGVIVNVSSIYGLVAPDQRIYGSSGINSSVAYAISKGSILSFTKYLASYWKDKGIRVNSITLGGVERKQSPQFIKKYSQKTMLGRMAKKSEYVDPILFLSSDSSSYMTGSNLIVDGGWTAW